MGQIIGLHWRRHWGMPTLRALYSRRCDLCARTHTQAHTHAYLHIHIRRQTRTHTRKRRQWHRHRLYAMPILQTLCYCRYVLFIVMLWTELVTNSLHDIGTDTVRRQLVRPWLSQVYVIYCLVMLWTELVTTHCMILALTLCHSKSSDPVLSQVCVIYHRVRV